MATGSVEASQDNGHLACYYTTNLILVGLWSESLDLHGSVEAAKLVTTQLT